MSERVLYCQLTVGCGVTWQPGLNKGHTDYYPTGNLPTYGKTRLICPTCEINAKFPLIQSMWSGLRYSDLSTFRRVRIAAEYFEINREVVIRAIKDQKYVKNHW
jgi:hypothetical protein